MRTLALIPARAGSKGVPGKNIRTLAGKPLIAWTIEAALASRHIDRVVVSSDGADILAAARDWGAETPFVRPTELARDDTPGIDVVLHALAQLPGFDWVVLLQPTSPLRLAADIDAAIETCREANAPACVSVTMPSKSPYWMYTLAGDGRMCPLIEQASLPTRRQDLPAVYALNGAVYVARVDWLERTRSFLTAETVAYTMLPERSIDIDTELDFRVAELVMSESRNDRVVA